MSRLAKVGASQNSEMSWGCASADGDNATGIKGQAAIGIGRSRQADNTVQIVRKPVGSPMRLRGW